ARTANHAQFDPADAGGFYESWFQRANHPDRPLAFWIRSTVFSPKGRPEEAVGELWAVYFDGERHTNTAARQEHPIPDTALARDRFDVRIGGSQLGPGRLTGAAGEEGRTIEWDLEWTGGQAPLFDLPPALYAKRLPRAKALVAAPLCTYSGALIVAGTRIEVDDWIGSQNHNWGVRHTDHYAWGQVAGFDDAPDAFLELATARLKLGPVWTPFMTPVVFRHEGREYAMNSLAKSFRKGSFTYFDWRFRAAGPELALEGTIRGQPRDFVALTYRNPPGGTKTCLNTKIASCRLALTFADGHKLALASTHRAAFEILTDDDDHGVPVRP
ncbi:MAG: hypothetical protein GWM90_09570, partial [Gemmatimonadetes bacterium]|nr:hypothetical protein [Gemmatimonadota bacterium]NIQ54151.1 hypothetical protein [Gemmatimonadota bacterium]NIU74345.1 hypothetical protein [Gammaproteobacteria bacterium]NIX44352.1 hypothetical protein [Gemmatimonadota bacterium]NIY08573.1 hypothetical protein [Gemmatimonadota bacterium]